MSAPSPKQVELLVRLYIQRRQDKVLPRDLRDEIENLRAEAATKTAEQLSAVITRWNAESGFDKTVSKATAAQMNFIRDLEHKIYGRLQTRSTMTYAEADERIQWLQRQRKPKVTTSNVTDIFSREAVGE